MFNPESKLLGRLLGREGPQGWAELLATSLSPAGVLSIGTSGAHSQSAARDALLTPAHPGAVDTEACPRL